MAVKCRDLPGIDFRFAPPVRGRKHAALAAAGLMGDFIPPLTSWANRKFAVDIDGHTNAWSNLLERFHLGGCCVLKVESQFDYRQWYYGRLVPFETHVPVKADLSNLEERLDWIRRNDAHCQQIAANGQALAQSLDFESQTRWAGGKAITQRFTEAQSLSRLGP